jgi:hypothetical protein
MLTTHKSVFCVVTPDVSEEYLHCRKSKSGKKPAEAVGKLRPSLPLLTASVWSVNNSIGYSVN